MIRLSFIFYSLLGIAERDKNYSQFILFVFLLVIIITQVDDREIA